MPPISNRTRVSNYRSALRIAIFGGIALLAAWATFTGYSASLEGSKGVKSEALATAPKDTKAKQRVNLSKTYGKLPLSFEANTGQTDPQVKYFARVAGYNLFFTATETVFVFRGAGKAQAAADQADDEVQDADPVTQQDHRDRLRRRLSDEASAKETVLRMRLDGADTAAGSIQGAEELAGKVNYFYGPDPEKWSPDHSTYGKVSYNKVYPGIDLVFYGTQQQLEYDLVVAPGADPGLIQIAFEGADGISVDKKGNLLLKTGAGDIQQNRPTIFQEVDGVKKEVKGNYTLRQGNKIGFRVSHYNRRKPLIIDPILKYLSFVNGSGEGIGITTDPAGNTYFTGNVDDNNLNATPGAFQIATAGGLDTFVTKLNPTGHSVVYTTYLGGPNDDYANGITVDAAGNAYIAGAAGASFPTTAGAFQTTFGGYLDSFITKLNPTGSALVFSTLLGGNGTDEADNLIVDSAGAIYVSGLAGSSNMPTTAGAFRTTYAGGDDGYAAKLNATGTALNYLTYIGGGGFDYPIHMAADSAGNVYLGGQTSSLNFPTQNPLQPSIGGPSRGVFKSSNAGVTWALSRSGLTSTFVYAMAIDPTTPSTIYAGTDGGVFKSTNFGATWNATGPMPARWVRQILIDPTSTNTIYAGADVGVFRSTDGGATWVARSNGLTFPNITADIRGLAMHPSVPDTIFAAGFGGVFKTTNAGASWVPLNVPFTSSSSNSNTNAIVIDPSNVNMVYVCIAGARVYKTLNGGTNWSFAGTGLPTTVNTLAINPTTPNTLYAGTSVGMFRTTDGGVTWTQINAGLLLARSDGSTSTPLINCIAIDPTNPTTVYAAPNFAAANNGSSYSFATIFKSVNSGGTWTAQGNGFNNAFTRFSSVVVDPGNASNVYTGTFGDTDGFIFKLNPSGSAAVFSTYLGGERNDTLSGIALDPSNNVYVSGTAGLGFPTTAGAFQTTLKGFNDVFASQLSAAGSALVYSTYLGGTEIEGSLGGLAVDASGNAYITGYTFATDFPVTPGAFQSAIGNPATRNNDVFVTKLNPSGSALVYSSYLGGEGNDAVNLFYGNRISLDAAANAYVLGVSTSTNFPAFDSVNIGVATRTFVAKIDANIDSYSITGRLTTSTNAPIAGVSVTASTSTGFVRDGVSDSQGYYSIISLPVGNYTVTPGNYGSSGHFLFTPPTRTFNGLASNQTANFTGTPVYSIYGQISHATIPGLGIFDVTVTLSGSASQSTISDAQGNFVFNDLPAGNYTVTPSKPGFTFSPVNRVYNAIATDQFATFTTTSGSYYTISGRAATPANVGISNVNVAMVLSPLRGHQQVSAVTDANGNYSFPNLQAGGNYTFLATKPLLSFTPLSPIFNNLSGNQTLNFTSAPVTGLLGKIVFVSSSTTSSNVSVMNADTTGEINLNVLNNQCNSDAESGPTWSPDGSRIAFSDCSNNINDDVNLYVMKSDGTGVTQVTNQPQQEIFPSWSPDGTKLTYTFGECSGTDTLIPEIFAIDATGANRRQLTHNSIIDAYSDWSPNGSSIVFARANTSDCNSSGFTAHIFRMDSLGGNESQLTNTSTSSEVTPMYSPDGSKIAYSSQFDDPANNTFNENIYVMNADGTNQIKITPDTIFAFKPTWSPDGTKLAFQGFLTGVNAAYQLFVVNADGTGLAQLTDDATERRTPSWQHYSISGHLTGNTEGPVTMVLAGTLTRVTQTDANGDYIFGNLTPGGNYSVTPVSTAFTFTPAKIDVTNLTGNPNANLTVAAAQPTPTPPLNDDFGGAQRDPARWNLGTQTQPLGAYDPQVTVVQQNGQLVVTPRSNVPDLHFNGYVSVNSFDFNNASATVEVSQAATGGADTVFAIGSDLDNFFRFVVRYGSNAPDMYNPSQHQPSGGGLKTPGSVAQLIFQIRIGGQLTSLSIPYDASLHRFMRFRHDPAQNAIVFETSPDDQVYFEQQRVVLSRSVSALTVELSAGTSTPTNPGQAIFDNFHLVTNTFQFSSPTFSKNDATIGEGAARVTLTVSRVGSTSSPATVGYITRDTAGLANCNVISGIASSRCDYATSIGTVHFDAGESFRTFSVPIVDDGFAEGPETFTVSVRNGSGGGIGTPSRAIVTINDNEGTSDGPNPAYQTPFFVRQQYVDFLSREPDPAGYQGWQDIINHCTPGDTECDQIHVSSAFFRSPEFQERGYLVYRLYPTAFGRKPDYAEFIPDLAMVSGFLTADELEAQRVALINELMTRQEFVDKYNALNNTQYVDTLLMSAGVMLASRQTLIDDLNTLRKTRAQVLREISESPEVYAKFYNQAFVVMQYFGYLRRDPDALYLDWIRVLETTGDFRGMVNGFMNSLEYRFRFGT
ncbi:MAG: carboxypeptidase regulatory-like domain-containing protein [bacterium]